jgi:hypothetical protein
MANIKEQPDYSINEEYQKAFTRTMDKLVKKFAASSCSLTPLEKHPLGQYMLHGVGTVTTEGEGRLGHVTEITDIPVDLFILPGASSDNSLQWVNNLSVLIPEFFKGNDTVHEVRLQEYVLMMNGIALGGSFASMKGSSDLLWKTDEKFSSLSDSRLRLEITKHASARYAWAPHFDCAKIVLERYTTPQDLFKFMTEKNNPLLH